MCICKSFFCNQYSNYKIKLMKKNIIETQPLLCLFICLFLGQQNKLLSIIQELTYVTTERLKIHLSLFISVGMEVEHF